MKILKSFFLAALLFMGCSGGNQPTTTPTAAPSSPATPAATATPTATATPEAPQPSTNLNSEEGISNLQKMIDQQVNDKVLTAKNSEKDNMAIVAWGGEAGVRRINVKVTHSPEHKEDITYWCQEGKVVSVGGNGKNGEENYFYWAGISPDGTLQGPPFKKVAGKSVDFTEEEVRKRHADGEALLKEVSGS